jgi:hypothetical protein
MEYIKLFTRYRSKEGDLGIIIANTEVASLMPIIFWDMIVKTFEELKKSESYFHFEKSDRNTVDNVINIIKEQLKEK